MTRSLGLVLIAVGLLAPAAAEAAETMGGWRATVERYAGLEPAEQRAWIRALVRRLDRANRAALSSNEAAEAEARHAALLDQVAQGRTLERDELLRLLREIELAERAAVEQLARRYRIGVYDTFRTDRDEFVRRRAASDLAVASWEAIGSPPDRQGLLVDWFEAAINRSTPGSVGPLPRLPDFAVAAIVVSPEDVVAERQETPPRVEVVVPRPAEGQTDPTIAVGPDLASPGMRRPVTEPSARQPAGGAIGSLEPRPEPPSDLAGRRRTESATTVPDEPAGPHRQPAEGPTLSVPIATPVVPPVFPVEPPVDALGADDGARRGAAPPVVRLPPLTNVTPTEPEMPLGTPPAASQRIASAGSGGLGGASREIARPAAALPLPGSADAVPTATEPDTGAVQPTAPRAANSHGINVVELAARVAGINMALQALEVDLAADPDTRGDGEGRWNAQRLAPLADRLEVLAIRQQDLEIFCELITPRERVQVGSLDSPQGAVSRLAARVSEARLHAMGPSFVGTVAQRQAELQQLDAISRQLARIAAAP